MPILVSTVVAPQIVEDNRWLGLDMTWTGPDGNVFDLTDPDGGILLQRGVIGMDMPPFVRYTSTAPGIAGSRNRGYRAAERPVFWPVFIWSDFSSAEFLSRWAAFMGTLRPGATGVWAVTNPVTAQTRRLTCRYSDEPSAGFEMDPMQFGWVSIGFDLVAEQPFWLGDPIVRTFAAPDSTQFFVADSGASGDVFVIAPGGTTDSAFIPNPGDEDAWPTYVITDVAGATLAAGGGSVVVGAVAPGVKLTIVTDPNVQTAIDSNGVDQTANVTWNALPVPKGSQVELDITLNTPGSTASVTASVQPVFYRAFG